MDRFIEFISMSDPNVRYVALGSILLTSCSAIVGVFTFLRKKALIGDAVAHAVLPGICIGFLFSGVKDPVTLIIGAFISGWLSLIIIDKITQLSKIKEDSAIGLVLSVSFGFGILLLTYIQHSGNAEQSGLDSFIFGKAASLTFEDLKVFSIVAVIIIVIIALFFRQFSIISFDREYAVSIGIPVKFYDGLQTSLVVLAVVVGIQAVGVVLMAAILITPAAAARFWTHKLSTMVVLAAIFGGLSGLSGAYISYLAPAMPTGPWIVVVISTIAMFSFFFAPVKGIIYKVVRQRRYKKQMVDENILKAAYHLMESQGIENGFSSIDIMNQRAMRSAELEHGLKRLKRRNLVTKIGEQYQFTDAGKEKGKRITRLHRLWELYLTEYLNIAPDHVHDDAETIEHVITPDLEKRLLVLLEHPEYDPHQSKIPY